MKPIALLLIISLVVKLILSAWLPLSADEAYYWVWSHSLSLSYYDHPPFVAWLYWLAHPFENFFSAVRWPGVLIGHITLCIWINILKPHLSERALFWFVALALLSPFTGPGSLIITPDTPLLFFWSVLVWGMLKAKEDTNLIWPTFLGVVLGLGFLSKYTVVLFFPMAIAVFLHAKWSWARLLSAAAVGTIGFALASWPVWYWNMQHDWISFTFQANHGLGAKSWKSTWTTDYIFSQIAFIFPTVFYFAARNRPAPFWLKVFAWTPLAFFLLTSFRAYAEANWPIVAYLPLIALAVWGMDEFKWAKWTAGIWAFAFALVLSLVANFWLPMDPGKTKLKELFIKPELYDFVISTDERIYLRSYQTASKLSFELKEPFYKLRGMTRFDFYDMHPGSMANEAQFWLIAEKNDKLPFGINLSYDKVESVDLGENLQAWRLIRK